jgi:hypothetical protein
MVGDAKQKMFQDAGDQELSEEQCNLLHGKAGLALTHHFKSFVDATNQHLS